MAVVKQRATGSDFELPLYLRTKSGYTQVQLATVGTTPAPTTPPEPSLNPIDSWLQQGNGLVAHRLLGARFPEFTEQGMRLAKRLGYKAFEYSVYRTKDGVFVGSHDWTTERTTGVRHEIWDTTWEQIQALDQQGGKITRLEDIVAALPEDGILFLDHKATSHTAEPTVWNVQYETELFELLETLFDRPQDRVIWKVFAEATSVDRAIERGYKTNGMLYPSTLPTADLSKYDILGMEWNAPFEAFSTLHETGKPVIAHIIYTSSQRQQASTKGATLFMVSDPGAIS